MLTLSMKKSFCYEERQKRRGSRSSDSPVSVERGEGSSSSGSQLHVGDAESSQQRSGPSEPCPDQHPAGELGLHAHPNHHITPDGDKTQGWGRKVAPFIWTKQVSTRRHKEWGRRGLDRKQAAVEHSWSSALRSRTIFLGVVSSAWRAGHRRSAVTHPRTTVSLFRQYI